MSESDRRLAGRLLAGDPGALDAFFWDQVPRLYRFARRRLGVRHYLTEDVVQETLVKTIDKLDNFRGDSALSTWMCTVCWRVIQDMQVRARRHPETALVDEDLDFRATDDARAAAERDDPEAAFLQNENARQVHEVLDNLPPPYGEALEWKYIEELSVKEIATRLGITPKAAESMLVRARVAFRRALETEPADGLPAVSELPT